MPVKRSTSWTKRKLDEYAGVSPRKLDDYAGVSPRPLEQKQLDDYAGVSPRPAEGLQTKSDPQSLVFELHLYCT